MYHYELDQYFLIDINYDLDSFHNFQEKVLENEDKDSKSPKEEVKALNDQDENHNIKENDHQAVDADKVCFRSISRSILLALIEFDALHLCLYYLGNKYIAKIIISSFMVCKSTNDASQ